MNKSSNRFRSRNNLAIASISSRTEASSSSPTALRYSRAQWSATPLAEGMLLGGAIERPAPHRIASRSAAMDSRSRVAVSARIRNEDFFNETH
ncbi:MAG: hypothetical protein MI923_09815 [Phycisphaerales bacterium]|nr:hypothetical protein [Phycisphaerales bacterium]